VTGIDLLHQVQIQWKRERERRATSSTGISGGLVVLNYRQEVVYQEKYNLGNFKLIYGGELEGTT
jgi:hypothetical protein